MKIPRLMLCGVSSGSGKTMVTCGILQAFVRRGLRTGAYKCGPDYIDPMFHTVVIGARSGNLDSFFMEPEMLRHLLARSAAENDISVIEGVMGYYDGIATTDLASSYSVAAATETPAVLVVPARGMGLSIAAMVEGYCRFAANSRIRGVILNRVSPAIYGELKREIEARCGVTVYGYVPNLPELAVESRHLGLHMPDEVDGLREKLDLLAAKLEETVDLDGLLRLAATAPELDGKASTLHTGPHVRIAVAKDEAFCFYYAENLQLLEDLGAELVPFSPLQDAALPAGISGLLLGGGYPELYAEALSKNRAMLEQIRAAVAAGLPTIAECGGFLYLQEWLEDIDGRVWPMAGALPGRGFYTGKLRRFGYVELTAREDTLYGPAGTVLRGHEFHYFDVDEPGDSFRAEKPVRGTAWGCIKGTKTLLAGFPHVCFYSNPRCAESFLNACRAWDKEGVQ